MADSGAPTGGSGFLGLLSPGVASQGNSTQNTNAFQGMLGGGVQPEGNNQSGANSALVGKLIEKVTSPKIESPKSTNPMNFYGGETVSQIKSATNVKITGGPSGVNSKDGKTFYNNVCIPRKKV